MATPRAGENPDRREPLGTSSKVTVAPSRNYDRGRGATRCSRKLLRSNAEDELGVALGEQAALALMGREGYVDRRVARHLGRERMSYRDLRRDIERFGKLDRRYLV